MEYLINFIKANFITNFSIDARYLNRNNISDIITSSINIIILGTPYKVVESLSRHISDSVFPQSNSFNF